MNIEKQVCTADQAKRLRDLGVSAPSHFEWNVYEKFSTVKEAQQNENPAGILGHSEWGADQDLHYVNYGKHLGTYNAYTVAELGILLPPFFPSFVHDNRLASHCINYRMDTFPLIYSGQEHEVTPAHLLNKELVPLQSGRFEAESRAEMLIFLIESGYLIADLCSAWLRQHK